MRPTDNAVLIIFKNCDVCIPHVLPDACNIEQYDIFGNIAWVFCPPPLPQLFFDNLCGMKAKTNDSRIPIKEAYAVHKGHFPILLMGEIVI